MYRLVRPLLFALPAETAHRLVFTTLGATGPLARGVARALAGAPDPRLAVEVAGLPMRGPVGLAAGLDKDGRLPRLWAALGFGAVELGTVTAHAQPGNPRPRLFRFPAAGALVNRMGFNNGGSERLGERLEALRARRSAFPVPLGVNLGKSKVTPLEDAPQDYATSARRVACHADYLVINVSSPNTPGLRSLQDPGHLRAILSAVTDEAAGRPVFVKLSPDLSDEALGEAVVVAEEGRAAGIIATNTTIARHGLADVGAGGTSGRPLAPRALEVITRVSRSTGLPVVGVGGIASTAAALRALAAGAASVQLYSGLVFEGPTLAARIHRELSRQLDRRGLADLAELVALVRADPSAIEALDA